MKFLRPFSFLLMTPLFYLPFCEAYAQQWVFRSPLPGGMTEVKVIENIPLPESQQELIGQEVIFKKVMTQADAESFHYEAKFEKSLPRPLAGKPLWTTAKTAWSKADEEDYSRWVFNEVDETFDLNSGLNGDCADIGLLIRWVYARNHHLPIANTLIGSGRLFGHFSSSAAWDHLATSEDWKNDERFKEALRYLFDNTNVESIALDQYPTFLTPEWVKPGSMYMIRRAEGGHTQTIKSAGPEAIHTLWGNEPAAERIRLSTLIWELSSKHTFGRWRQVHQKQESPKPAWELISAKKMPGYSLEQYDVDHSDPYIFMLWVHDHLGIQTSDHDRLNAVIHALIDGLNLRGDVTAQGEIFCSLRPCAHSSPEYNNFSTFSRDARLRTDQQAMFALIEKLGGSSEAVQENLKELTEWGQLFTESKLTYEQIILDPARISRMSSDPARPFAERWGYLSAELNPNLLFQLDADVMLTNLGIRRLKVDEARYFLSLGTDPNSPSVLGLNTKQLDEGLRLEFARIQSDLDPNGGVDPQTLENTRNDYRSRWGFKSETLCDPVAKGCTLDDFIFTDEAKLRFSKWSSDPRVSVPERWGF